MSVVIVAGALANKPANGGGAWERMSWAAGLRRLGFDVWFVEQVTPAALGAGVPSDWFRAVTQWFGFADRSILFSDEHREGAAWLRLLEVAEAADLLVNLSGHLTSGPLLSRIRRKAYVDVDPGFTQFWHLDSETSFTVEGHDFHFTIGENIGTSGCPIPTGGLRWRPTRQPIVLDQWPVTAGMPHRFTTVASWRGAYGPVTFEGRTLGIKAHEFRRILPLPGRVPGATFELALDIHPADVRDAVALREQGWTLVDPRSVAGGPAEFRSYIQASGAEFSVAQGVYVETGSGWFSDRTTRYLASGKPVLVQETGFSRNLPAGEGLVPFRTLDEAVAGAGRILRDYDRHGRSARAIAEEFFDSDRVLIRFLDEIGICP